MDFTKSCVTLILAATFLLFTFLSCDTTSSLSYEPITISGLVTDSDDNPIQNAMVRITSPPPEQTGITDEEGFFSFTVEVDSSMTFVVEATKEGYQPVSLQYQTIPERDSEVQVFRLLLEGEDDDDDDNGVTPPGESEGSAYITLESLSRETIQVRETGGVEMATFEFVVTDSAGTVVSNQNAVDVHFEIASGPGGGESVYPESVMTENGIARASLTSGTAAGVVQLRASFTREGNTMQSKPVAISISGGLPDNNHFEVRTDQRNVASTTNDPTIITALLGDKYGNTVTEGTAVYFGTSRGTINGSASTDSEGYASSGLRTNNDSPGTATVRVETIDENSVTLSREIEILFSGKPQLTVSPQSLDLNDFTSQEFQVSLEDENGNPLAEGTTLTVEMDHPELELSGSTSVTLPDSRESGPETTDFTFTIRNPERLPLTQNVSISISSEGPNGSVSRQLHFDAPELPAAEPASIYLEELSLRDIVVQGAGPREDTQLTFQVVDVNGNPLSDENSVDVEFRFGSYPGGGAYVTDVPVTTNSNGQAVATVISGTAAGVAQVIAEFEKPDGSIVHSQPVQIVIHAGSPSQDHFTIYTEQYNISLKAGEEYAIGVLVGDRYGNEVPDGTAIYFTTDIGVIYGSAYTVDGKASTRLSIGNPIPLGGIGTVTASTADDNNQPVTASLDLTYSGSPVITITPETFDIPNAGDQEFHYTVMDDNGFPMAPGTQITVTAEGHDITLLGQVDVEVGDLNFDSSNLSELTEYQFTIADADHDVIKDTPAYITITVDGPNGKASKTISGRKAKGRF